MTITYPKLKPSFKAKWIAALRSGEYARGCGFLCRTGKKYDYFCCLGVACDIVAPGEWHGSGVSDECLRTREDYTRRPPPSMDKEFFVKGSSEVQRYETLMELAGRNDSNWSFNRIATWIEKNL